MNSSKSIAFSIIILLGLFSGAVFGAWNLVWTGENGFEKDGVQPDEGANGASYKFRVRFNSDEPNVHPYWVRLFIDLNGDGKFSEDSEVFECAQTDDVPSIWFVEKQIKIVSQQRPHIAYYFMAFADNKIKSSELCFGPVIGGYNHSFVIEGKGWFLDEALLPMEMKTMKERDRILFINTSSTPQRLSISIPEDAPGPFFPHVNKDTQEANAYVMSVVITDTDREYVNPDDFNSEGSEDVISFKPKKAKGSVLGLNSKNYGERVMPGESVAIWMQLRAPAYAFGVDGSEEQWIYIKIEVAQTE
ncbi:hypothetical protein KAH81_03620 [bacterium]|nr:hypothetical protein [bacterium]